MNNNVKRPKLKRDWIGRHVRLKVETRSNGGLIFPVGMVMLVTHNYGGLTVETITVCPHCGMGRKHSITKVPESYVELLPEGYEP